MPYIGKSPEHGNFTELTDISGSFDGSTTQFALTENISSTAITPVVSAALLISINGVIQEPTTDYTVSGTNITFTSAPASTDSFFGVVMGTQLDVGTPSDSTVTAAKLASTFLSGATDIGAAVVDADLLLIDDGAGGTFRKVTASRLKTYMGADPVSADGDSLGTASLEWSDLYLADGGVIYFGNDQDVTVTHDPDDGLFLKSTATADGNPFLLTLQTGETNMEQDDIIGRINFQAPDEGTGTDAILVAAGISAISEGDFSSSNNATKLSFATAASEAAAEKMKLTSGGNLGITTDGASVFFGADAEVELTHVHNTGLIIKENRSTNTTPVTLTLQTGEADISDTETLGTLAFQAPNDDAGTDANLVAAAISAVADATFSSSVNKTALVFKTGESEAATEKMRLSSGGDLTVTGTGAVMGTFTQTAAGNNGIRVIANHASYTGNCISPWAERAGSSAFDLIEAVTGNGAVVPFRVRGDGYTTINAALADPALVVFNDGNATNIQGIKIQCGTDDASGTNYAIRFYDGDGGEQGNITFSGGTVGYNAFTAGHECILPNSDNDSGYAYGTLVETTSIGYKNSSDRGIVYTVRKSQSANSKAVLGAYSGDLKNPQKLYTSEDNEVRAGTKNVGDVMHAAVTNLHEVYVLGDGHILCNNAGGNISVGDGICTSSTAGIGQKATANPSMIVGIAQEDTTFANNSETKLVPVQYGVQQFVPWS